MFFMRRAPTPLLPEDDVPSDLPGLSCPTAPRQKWARRSVKTAVKRRAPTPLLPPSKRSTPAPLVDRWHDGAEEDVCPPQFPFCPKRTPGPQLDFQKSYSPLDIFKLFFTPRVIQTLCTNTNAYAARALAQGAKTPWKDVKPDEMYRYLSLVLYLGVVRVTAARDLWRKDRLFRFPFPGEVYKIGRAHV